MSHSLVSYALTETILAFSSLVLPPTCNGSINVLYDLWTRAEDCTASGSVGSPALAVFLDRRLCGGVASN